MFTKTILSMFLVAAIGIGCSSDLPTQSNAAMDDSISGDIFLASSNSLKQSHRDDAGYDNTVMFTVRIENISDGMTLKLSNGETAPAPNSPGVWAVTALKNPLFTVGQYDAEIGLEQQAEDGDPTMLASNIENDDYVKSSGIFNTPVGDDSPGPALPGKAYEFTVTATPGDHLSLTSMFGQSNDLFYAPGMVGIPLFHGKMPVNGDVTRFFRLWDAGTEVNQEPGLGEDQAPRQSGPNTGESEHLRIIPVHDEYTYPPTDEVIKVTITPI